MCRWGQRDRPTVLYFFYLYSGSCKLASSRLQPHCSVPTCMYPCFVAGMLWRPSCSGTVRHRHPPILRHSNEDSFSNSILRTFVDDKSFNLLRLFMMSVFRDVHARHQQCSLNANQLLRTRNKKLLQFNWQKELSDSSDLMTSRPPFSSVTIDLAVTKR